MSCCRNGPIRDASCEPLTHLRFRCWQATTMVPAVIIQIVISLAHITVRAEDHFGTCVVQYGLSRAV
jgi:hypothetical protein